MRNLKYYREEVFGSQTFSIYQKYMTSDVIFSQFDMAMVQSAFFASVVVFPEWVACIQWAIYFVFNHETLHCRCFGAGSCSNEYFDDFLHMWKVFGYYLGVEDKYNLVRENVHQTRKLLLAIGNEIIIPCVINLNLTSLHMAKCVSKAYNIDYHLLVYSHCFSKSILFKK